MRRPVTATRDMLSLSPRGVGCERRSSTSHIILLNTFSDRRCTLIFLIRSLSGTICPVSLGDNLFSGEVCSVFSYENLNVARLSSLDEDLSTASILLSFLLTFGLKDGSSCSRLLFLLVNISLLVDAALFDFSISRRLGDLVERDCADIGRLFVLDEVAFPDLIHRSSIISLALPERVELPQTLKYFCMSPFIFLIIISIKSR
mmetsp:Transcript_18735/g.22356  ORF Transcript_18735/g.22356 Transcript_18735/m.22356 type:complete len:203 (+) Transcript_18735:2318-2926(+)